MDSRSRPYDPGEPAEAGRVAEGRARLSPLLAAFEAAVPGVPARPGPPAAGAVVPGGDNGGALDGLVAAIAAAEPDAGPGFWPVRAWSMLIWQPVVLAQLGVHEARCLPDLGAAGQTVAGAAVRGVQVPGAAALDGDETADIERAGRHLRRVTDDLFVELAGVAALKPELARRLLADRVTGVLLRRADRVDMPAARVRVLVDRWLAATDLTGRSGVLMAGPGPGASGLDVDRRACCLEFRAAAGRECETCPRRRRGRRGTPAHVGEVRDVPTV